MMIKRFSIYGAELYKAFFSIGIFTIIYLIYNIKQYNYV